MHMRLLRQVFLPQRGQGVQVRRMDNGQLSIAQTHSIHVLVVNGIICAQFIAHEVYILNRRIRMN